MKKIAVKRVYESFSASDGTRILVDRLWPRGLSKAEAHIDIWLKDIAPSNELRQWFHHEPDKWSEFKKRYFKELAQHHDLLDSILSQARSTPVTLLFSAKDETHNNAIALIEFLEKSK